MKRYGVRGSWDIMRAFIREKGLVRQHLDSFNDFLEYRLQNIVNDFEVLHTEIVDLKFGKITVNKPYAYGESKNKLYPMEARIRNLTYAGEIKLEVTPIVEGVEQQTVSVTIGRMPIMLKSKACWLYGMSDEELLEIGEDPADPGGYFIINGSERVLVAIEDLAPNRVIVEESDRHGKKLYVAKIFSRRRGYRVLNVVERDSKGVLTVNFPPLPNPISLITVMRALGLETDQEIVEAIASDPEDAEILQDIYANIEECPVDTQEEALDAIGRRVAPGQPREYRLMRAEMVLDRQVLPHIGITKDFRKAKARFLGRMAEMVIELALGRRVEDDKDHYANKRLKLAGDLMEELFRYAFQQLLKDIKYQIERAFMRGRDPLRNISSVIRADVITDRLQHALATGNWVGGKTGVSQLLDRTNYVSTLSHLRRVTSTLSRSQPHFEARDLHSTHWGRICPNETPEGPNCGLVKNLALMVEFSIGLPEEEERKLEKLLYNKFGVIPLEGGR